MREARNPFRLRASEQIESDVMFLRLFGPAMLGPLHLAEEGVECFRIIRSAPGGGKTTLMRLFTPGPLKALHANRGQEDVKELHGALREVGVLNDDGPQLLGAMVSCSRTFADIADIGLGELQQQGMFLALLDARLTLAALRSLVAVRDGTFPEDLGRVELSIPAEVGQRVGISGECTGKELYLWAQKIEEGICSALFSFDPMKDLPSGHDSLIAPLLLAAPNLRFDGREEVKQVVFMLDDAHRLASNQRRNLIDLLVNLRARAGVWIAERLEALAPDELIRCGATEGRDYAATVLLEDHWQRKKADFRKLLENIADRRARSASDVAMDSFSGCLESQLDLTKWKDVLEEAQKAAEERIRRLSVGKNTFDAWIDECRTKGESPLEKALAWRRLEILIRRELGKRQTEFGFGLGASEYEKKDDSSLQSAAEAFLAGEHGIPYYYGLDRLVTLASSNVEQFLMLAGDEFEESAALALIQKPTALPADRQHEMAVRASKRLWEEVPRRAGEDVHKLLRAIAEFSQWYTFRPTAPNDPGVNGIAILMQDRGRLLDPAYLAKNAEHRAVADVIARAMQFNLLEPVLDYHCKGKDFMVLNLNRLLCPKYGLPLGRGLFKEQRLETLSNWLKSRFQKPKENDELC